MRKVSIVMALTVVMMLLLQTVSFAAVGAGTAVIGDKGYSLSYCIAAANQAEITAAVIAADKIYVKNFSGNWIDNDTGAAVAASVIPAFNLKNADGTTTAVAAGDAAATPTPVPATATPTLVPATATPTLVPATDTPTPVPATATPTATPAPQVTDKYVESATVIKLVLDTAVTSAQASAMTVTVNGVSVAVTGTVSADGKTVTLTSASNLILGATYAVNTGVAGNVNVTYNTPSLTVSVPNAATAITMVRGSLDNTIFKFRLTAGDSKVKVTQIVLTPYTNNTAVNTEFSQVTLNYADKSKDINNPAAGALTFNIADFSSDNTGINIARNSYADIEVTADTKVNQAVPGHTYALTIAAIGDITATADSIGGGAPTKNGVPVFGTTQTIGSAEIAATASVAPATSQPAGNAALVNATEADMLEFEITTGAKAVDWYSMSLLNAGSAVHQTDAVGGTYVYGTTPGFNDTTDQVSYGVYLYDKSAYTTNGTYTRPATADLTAAQNLTDGAGDMINNVSMSSGKLLMAVNGGAAIATLAASKTYVVRVVGKFGTATLAAGKTSQLSLGSAADIVLKDGTTALTPTFATVTGNTFTNKVADPVYNASFGAPTTQAAAASKVFQGTSSYFDVMKFSVTNTDSATDSTLTQVVIKRTAAAGYISYAQNNNLTGSEIELKILDQFGNQVVTDKTADASSDNYTIAGIAANNVIPYGSSRTFTVQARTNAANLARLKVGSPAAIGKLQFSLATADVTLGGPTKSPTAVTVTGPDITYAETGSATVTFDGAPTTLAGASISGIPQGGEYIAGKLTLTASSTENLSLNATSYVTVKVTGQSAADKVSIKKVYLVSDANKANIINTGAPVDANTTGTAIHLRLDIPASAQTIEAGTSETFVFVLDANADGDELAANKEVTGRNLRLTVVGNSDGTDTNEWFHDNGKVATVNNSTLTSSTNNTKINATASAQTLTSSAVTVTNALAMTYAVSESLPTSVDISAGVAKSKIAKVTFTNNGSEDINVNQLTMTPAGGSTLNGVADGQYMLLDSDGTTVLGSAANCNTTTLITFGTANTKMFAVPAGGTKDIYVGLTLATTATDGRVENGLAVGVVAENATAIACQGAVTNAQLVPTTGAGTTARTATAKAATVYTIAADTTTLASGPKTSGSNIMVAAFTLTPDHHYSSVNSIQIKGLKNGDLYTLKDASGNALGYGIAAGGAVTFTFTAVKLDALDGTNTPQPVKFSVWAPLAVSQSLTVSVADNGVTNGAAGADTAGAADVALQAIVGQ